MRSTSRSRTRRRQIVRRRIVAAAVVLAAAASAPIAAAATSSSGVHTQVQRDGTIQVSGFDGGAALSAAGR